MTQSIQDFLMVERAHPAREQLVAFLNGQVSPEDSAQVIGHLKTCPQCMAIFASLQAPIVFLGREFAAAQVNALAPYEGICMEIGKALMEVQRSGETRALHYPVRQEAAWFAAADLAIELLQNSGAAIRVEHNTPEAGSTTLTIRSGRVRLCRRADAAEE